MQEPIPLFFLLVAILFQQILRLMVLIEVVKTDSTSGSTVNLGGQTEGFTIKGDAVVDNITGANGNDIITGANGDDIINGGAGNDSINGGEAR